MSVALLQNLTVLSSVGARIEPVVVHRKQSTQCPTVWKHDLLRKIDDLVKIYFAAKHFGLKQDITLETEKNYMFFFGLAEGKFNSLNDRIHKLEIINSENNSSDMMADLKSDADKQKQEIEDVRNHFICEGEFYTYNYVVNCTSFDYESYSPWNRLSRYDYLISTWWFCKTFTELVKNDLR